MQRVPFQIISPGAQHRVRGMLDIDPDLRDMVMTWRNQLKVLQHEIDDHTGAMHDIIQQHSDRMQRLDQWLSGNHSSTAPTVQAMPDTEIRDIAEALTPAARQWLGSVRSVLEQIEGQLDTEIQSKESRLQVINGYITWVGQKLERSTGTS